jgi:hypothetical protein
MLNEKLLNPAIAVVWIVWMLLLHINKIIEGPQNSLLLYLSSLIVKGESLIEDADWTPRLWGDSY